MAQVPHRPGLGAAYMPAYPLTALHHGGGLTRYYFQRHLLHEAVRGDGPQHYPSVLPLLHAALVAANPKHPSPWREANLLWMAIRRTYPETRNSTTSFVP